MGVDCQCQTGQYHYAASLRFGWKYLLDKSAASKCSCNSTALSAAGTRFACFQNKWSQAPAEFAALRQTVMKGDFQMKQIMTAGGIGLQLAGLFFLGEVIGRGSLFGYAL